VGSRSSHAAPWWPRLVTAQEVGSQRPPSWPWGHRVPTRARGHPRLSSAQVPCAPDRPRRLSERLAQPDLSCHPQNTDLKEKLFLLQHIKMARGHVKARPSFLLGQRSGAGQMDRGRLLCLLLVVTTLRPFPPGSGLGGACRGAGNPADGCRGGLAPGTPQRGGLGFMGWWSQSGCVLRTLSSR
jgi:hypothetical protein